MRYLLVLIVFFQFLSCKKEVIKDQTKSDLRGEWAGNTYNNSEFGFKITIPKEWSLQKGHNKELNKMGSELVAGNDENLKNSLEQAALRSHKVMTVFRFPLGTPGKTNPNIQVILENISHFPGVKNGKDYLAIVEDNLKMGQLKINFTSAAEQVDLGKSKFYKRTAQIPYGGMNIDQQYFAKVHKGHVFFISITTMSKEDEKMIESIMKTVHE